MSALEASALVVHGNPFEGSHGNTFGTVSLQAESPEEDGLCPGIRAPSAHLPGLQLVVHLPHKLHASHAKAAQHGAGGDFRERWTPLHCRVHLMTLATVPSLCLCLQQTSNETDSADDALTVH